MAEPNDAEQPFLLATDELGLPVTQPRLDEIKSYFTFKSDTLSRNVCLVLDALADRVRDLAAMPRQQGAMSE